MAKRYECKMCYDLSKSSLKNRERFFGTRKDVRKHLRDKHDIKGSCGIGSGHKSNSQEVQSDLTKNTIVHDFS